MFQEWFKKYEKLIEKNNMSEEEILKYLYYFTSSNIKNKKLNLQDGCGFNLGFLYVETLQKTVEGLLDLYSKEKEQNKININSINDLIKECNEENKRCSELVIELQTEKEKNKELENCLQMAKQIMTVDISDDFDYMDLKEFKEYLLNEINENFEE